MLTYIAVYKPYGVLSQFTPDAPGQRTLSDVFDLPTDVYPLGRLDKDSEGLLLLSNDKSLNAKLLLPQHQHPRSYWVQVEGAPTEADLQPLRRGLRLRIDQKDYQTLPAEARRLLLPPPLAERVPPIRVRQAIPDAWLDLRLVEGKNRQVRRMCAAIGFPVLRLVRHRIGQLDLAGMQPGDAMRLSRELVERKLLG